MYGRAAGLKGEYTLAKPVCRKILVDLIRHYAAGYSCRVAALSGMGSHYHLVMQFDAYRGLSPEELRERALLLYPSSEADPSGKEQSQALFSQRSLILCSI